MAGEPARGLASAHAAADPLPIAPPKESFSLIPLLTLASGMHGPATVPTDSAPGELFIVRNMGNFIPPFEPDAGYHGTSAAMSSRF